MGRHSSFGSRLGAYRNRQIRLAIGRSSRRSRKQAPVPTPTAEQQVIVAVVLVVIFIIMMACFSSMAYYF